VVCISDSEGTGRLQLIKNSNDPTSVQVLLVNDRANFSPYLEQELRSDHAGETGAVYIYKGIVAIARLSNDLELISFAKNHGATESEHVKLMESVLPKDLQSRLLLMWRIAGWLIGAVPALFGRKAVYATIAAVETFVEQHYQAQIDQLLLNRSHRGLLQLLQRCQADEIDHKHEAAIALGDAKLGFILRIWCSLMHIGSRGAVAVCRRV
jgi:3-demethoxyubiquinol 3-hydroxylase